MKRIEVTASASCDINRIAAHTREVWGEKQWNTYRDLIENTFTALSLMPKIGRRRDGLADRLRSIVSGQHIVFYRETADVVEIVRIYHSSEDIDNKFAEKED